jgi:hypothetical protein
MNIDAKGTTRGTTRRVRGAGISIIAGADIHIFVFTDCEFKNNGFQKKLIGQNTNI